MPGGLVSGTPPRRHPRRPNLTNFTLFDLQLYPFNFTPLNFTLFWDPDFGTLPFQLYPFSDKFGQLYPQTLPFSGQNLIKNAQIFSRLRRAIFIKNAYFTLLNAQFFSPAAGYFH